MEEPARPTLRAKLSSVWDATRAFLQLFLYVRFSLILGVLAGITFLYVPQAQEILLHLDEEGGFFGSLCFVAAALYCSAGAWYCARLLLRVPRHDSIAHSRFRSVKMYLPRVLGAFVPVPLAFALVNATGNFGLAVLLSLSAIVFYAIVHTRRRWSTRWVKPFSQETDVGSLRELGSAARIYFAASIGLFLLALVFFSSRPGYLGLAPAVGAGSIVLVAAGVLMPIGTLVVYAGMRYKLPGISVFLVLAVFCSRCNDNHYVRQTVASRSTTPQAIQPPKATVSLRQEYLSWSAGLRSLDAITPKPVYIISAEGGGLRAAYWTAAVLGALQDAEPQFSRHVFAISGVSGGSLGAAVFAALPRDAAPNSRKDFQARGEAVLSRDFLSPTLAILLFPDFLQAFLPFPLMNDRAVGLETTWETAWLEQQKNNRFAEPFERLWRDDPERTPRLFLNSTVVESGNRMIVTPKAYSDFDSVFHDAVSAAETIGTEIPLSTAVHMSARFTYVSPAGTIRDGRSDEENWLRVVDGGYFENSGSVTANEILHLLLEIEAERPNSMIRPVIIHISSEPRPPGERFVESNEKGSKSVWLGELLSPLRAVIHARSARGYQARAQFLEEAKHLRLELDDLTVPGLQAHFGVEEEESVTLPLGWLLSQRARSAISMQLARAEQRRAIHRILAPLRSLYHR